MKPGQTISFVEKRRGDSEPPPDRLGLQRTLWLDFDGGGFTIRDRIAGTMERGWRLEMPGPALLGRVAVNGQDQFLTRLPGAAASGVEVRSGRVDIEADSRLAAPVSSLSAIGWDQDFHQASALLNLAPGSRLFHASGVDDVSATWISSWTLLDLFLALVIAMSVARPWGRRWGAFALLTLGLSWIEPGAPHWIWVAILAGEALKRGLPAGRLNRLVGVVHRLAMIGLVLIVLPFMARQIRAAIYPALGRPSAYFGEAFGPLAAARRAPAAAEPARNEEDKDLFEEGREDEAPVGGIASGKVAAKMAFSASSSLIPQTPPPRQALLTNLRVHDPAAVVQTGPGLPAWSWTTVSLRWNGPVERDQRLRLFLIPPALNFAL